MLNNAEREREIDRWIDTVDRQTDKYALVEYRVHKHEQLQSEALCPA